MAIGFKRVKHVLLGRPLPSKRLEHDDQVDENAPDELDEYATAALDQSAHGRVEAA